MSQGIHDYILTLLEKRKDLRHIAIVLPSLRPSFFLDKILAQDWGVIFPPKIFTIQGFWDYLLSQLENFQRVSLLEVLVDLKKVVEKYIPDLKDWKVFYPWAYPLFNAMEQITLAMVPEDKIKNVKGILVGHQSEDYFYQFWENFSSIRNEFYHQLKKKRMFTRAMVVSALRKRMEEISLKFEKIIIAGLFLETEMERECLRKLKSIAPVSIYLLKVSIPDLKEKFDILSHSLYADGVWDVSIDVSRITIFPCRSELDQVNQVCNSLPSCIQEPTEVGIVLPREELLMAFLDRMEDVRYPVNISMGYPMKSTSGYDFLQRLVRAFEHSNEGSIFYRDYLDLLSHFYMSEILPDLAETRTAIVRHSEETGRVFFTLEEIEACIPDSVKDRLRFLHQVLGKMIRESSVENIIDSLVQLLWFLIETNPSFSENRLEREVIYRFYLILNRILSSTISQEQVPVKVLFAYIRNLLLEEYIGFEGSPLKGLQIMGTLQARNLGFNRVYYLDLNEGICPKKSGTDLFLPDPIREFLGMPRLKDRELMYAYDFYSTLALSDEVRIYYVRWPDSRFPVSRYIHQLRFLARDQNTQLKECEDIPTLGVILPSVKEEFYKTPFDLEKVTSYSPSALDTYLKCPVRYYYKYILSIPEPLQTDEDLDHREIGNLIHSILSSIYQPVVKRPINQSFFDICKKKVEDVAREKALKEWGKLKYDSIRAQSILRVIIRRIQDFLDVEKQRWEQEEFKVEFVEQESEEMSFELELGDIFGPVKLLGRADRIDRIGDEFVIWDYKTGRISKPNLVSVLKEIELTRGNIRNQLRVIYTSLQLPIYLMLFSHSWNLSPCRSDAGLISLKELEYVRLFKTSRGHVRIENSDRKRLAELVYYHVVELIREIRDLSIPYQPDRTFCYHCPYRSACVLRGE